MAIDAELKGDLYYAIYLHSAIMNNAKGGGYYPLSAEYCQEANHLEWSSKIKIALIKEALGDYKGSLKDLCQLEDKLDKIRDKNIKSSGSFSAAYPWSQKETFHFTVKKITYGKAIFPFITEKKILLYLLLKDKKCLELINKETTRIMARLVSPYADQDSYKRRLCWLYIIKAKFLLIHKDEKGFINSAKTALYFNSDSDEARTLCIIALMSCSGRNVKAFKRLYSFKELLSGFEKSTYNGERVTIGGISNPNSIIDGELNLFISENQNNPKIIDEISRLRKLGEDQYLKKNRIKREEVYKSVLWKAGKIFTLNSLPVLRKFILKRWKDRLNNIELSCFKYYLNKSDNVKSLYLRIRFQIIEKVLRYTESIDGTIKENVLTNLDKEYIEDTIIKYDKYISSFKAINYNLMDYILERDALLQLIRKENDITISNKIKQLQKNLKKRSGFKNDLYKIDYRIRNYFNNKKALYRINLGADKRTLDKINKSQNYKNQYYKKIECVDDDYSYKDLWDASKFILLPNNDYFNSDQKHWAIVPSIDSE